MSEPSVDRLGEWVREAFALGAGPLRREAVARGARGLVSRLSVGDAAYALKQPDEAVDEAEVRAEAALLDHLAAAGVEVPVHLRTTTGAYAGQLPAALGGGAVRVTRWVEGVRAASAPRAPAAVGALLAALHRAAPPAARPPGSWWTTVSAPEVFSDLASRASDRPWGPELAARLPDLAVFAALVARAGRGAGPWLVGHRDLHPDNVLVAPDGSLRALDWEEAGAVDPGRELAKVLVQWHVDGDRVDEDAVRTTVAAYRSAGGPGRVRGEEDLALVLCTELNFLVRQAERALDPRTGDEARGLASADIDLSLRSYLPRPRTLRRVAELAAG
ncbi:phosphotransferase [Phycicoccus sp. 3266]|uniref:phosphotransferase n=1 Tax=Phycicoccus sp. 3266 TaxID=2817751 RepID=UPI0028649123|nr:phosphotransferase [Phycicoccus sp. 3266]MDR6864312.1 Ser/Thr protein kinase RdoA (MazF antagonist) [Phycicoccus sp. 3266]